MTRTQDNNAQLRRYLEGKRVDVDVDAALASLTADVDVELAVHVVMMLLGNTQRFGRCCKKLPPSVIRGVLAAEVRTANATASETHLFLRMAVDSDSDEGDLVRSWQRALGALLDMNTEYPWGSKQHRTKLQRLAEDSQILRAIQGVAATRSVTSNAMQAVLLLDGSKDSYDSLVTQVGKALETRDAALEAFARLRTYAKRTPFSDALFAEIDSALKERNRQSPALAVGDVIGVGRPETLWFEVHISSRQNNRNRVPRFQGSIKLDSREAGWFFVAVTEVDPDVRGRRTVFSDRELVTDELGLGSCRPEEIPAWLASAAVTLQIKWRPFHPSSNLRGKNLARIASWLAECPEKPATASRRSQGPRR